MVTAGTPEHVAADPASYTGEFLSRLVTPDDSRLRRRKVRAAG